MSQEDLGNDIDGELNLQSLNDTGNAEDQAGDQAAVRLLVPSRQLLLPIKAHPEIRLNEQGCSTLANLRSNLACSRSPKHSLFPLLTHWPFPPC